VIADVERTAGKPVPVVEAGRRPGDPAAIWADARRAAELLGWEARADLDDIARSAVRWQESHPNGYATGARPADPATARPAAAVHVAYVMSRFPKLTETFVLDEMIAVERHGARVELFPLLRERTDRVHAEAVPWIPRAHYLPFLSPAILASNAVMLVRRPRRYLGALGAMLAGTARSWNFLLGGIGIFPKVVHMARRMEALGIRHVHCHFANHPALAGFLVHRLTGIPYSFTAHGSDLNVDRTMLPQKVREAAFVVTISDTNRKLIEQTCGGPVPNLTVLHVGIDGRRFVPAVRAAESPGGDAPRILCIGTLHEVKGQRHLIAAARILADRGIPFVLSFVGDGPDRAELETLAASVPAVGRVEFLGQQTRDRIVDLLRTADLLVAPSVPTASGKREGIPVVLIEAMASGVAVVASHLSGIPELVEDGMTGLTVPPGDEAGLAAAIGGLLADPERRARLAAAGRARVETDFDLDTNAARLVAMFRGAAS
jgi:glycosyltransferase involved in cell wall biosynthesis